MSLLSLITGNDYITLVKKFINKIFLHEAKKYNLPDKEITILINKDTGGVMRILTYSNRDQKVLRHIPDEEVQKILTK